MNFGKTCRSGKDCEKKQERIDGMAIAEGGVGDVVDERIERREDGDGIGERTFCASEKQDSGDGAKSEKQIGNNDNAGEE
jgi:hypothetical protein